MHLFHFFQLCALLVLVQKTSAAGGTRNMAEQDSRTTDLRIPSTKVAKTSIVLAPGQNIDTGFIITEATSGNITGDGIYGELLSPYGDWFTLGPPRQEEGTIVGTLDIRGGFAMDDDSIVYVEYKGRVLFNATTFEVLHWVATPLFRTSSSTKYGYLMNNQYVMRLDQYIPASPNANGFVSYDVYRID